MVEVVLPSLLAAQAGGRSVFQVKATTVGEALHALPVADLLFDQNDKWNPYLLVYLDGTAVRDRGGLDCPLTEVSRLRVLALMAGG